MASDAPPPQQQQHQGRSLVAKRVALRIQPVPSVVLEYTDASGKPRLRTIKLQALLSGASDADALAAKVLASMPRQLDRRQVRVEEVRDVVAQLLQWHHQAQTSHEEEEQAAAVAAAAAAAAASATGTGGGRPPAPALQHLLLPGNSGEMDLNTVSPARLQAAKRAMDVAFNANRKQPGEPGFTWDVQREFAPVEASEWDD